ncbi:uncharacterized protein TNCV_3603021 [Trichonephila clavipes]|nr:uncharacterized protein TNCV_3603021 [Trichonephila clavipes]
MEWEPSYIEVSEPMDWEGIPQVRDSKRSKVSESVVFNVTLRDEAAPPVSKKVNPSLNITSLQEKATLPQPKKVSNISLTFEALQVKLTSSQLPKNKTDGPISYRSASEGDVARLNFPGAVQKVHIRSESRKDGPRGTTGSRPPSGVPRATLLSCKRDEAHFWLNGYVNKQNCRIWSEANPQVYVETSLHPEKLTVWCALWASGILLQKR